MAMRGSRKHILDLLDGKDYADVMNGLLAGSGAELSLHDQHKPEGAKNDKEWSIKNFLKEYRQHLPLVDLDNWWPGGRAKPPTWDLISTCKVGGQDGILLVEAKAHEGECDRKGKLLKSNASQASKDNHQKIDNCIQEACAGLNSVTQGGFNISSSCHYQLANRIACLWKLAQCGIPTVLIYLGFIGDKYFKYDYLMDSDHWQRVMGAYMHGIVPLDFPEHQFELKLGASLLMSIKSLPLHGIST